jgi:DNA-binding XRE family transcriptional regulator
MPNIAGVLKAEIARVARKEIREETQVLKRASAQHRRDLAEMKRRLADLQRRLGPLQKQVLKTAPSAAVPSRANGVRFTAKGLRSQRQRLGLSAADYGKLIGVTGQTIYSWEHETAWPRRQQVARLASLRRIGKRDAQARLEQLTPKTRKKSK